MRQAHRRGITSVIAYVVTLVSLCHTATHAQPTPLATAFTYQGELAAAGTPATGTYDLRFRLYDAAAAGTQIGSTLCSDNLAVSAGRFAASLDFGSTAFSGQKRFLEIEVRLDTGLGCGDATGYTVLSPRQEVTAAPSATFAQTAATAANAASLNGQTSSFYQNAANLTGTLADAQLSSNVARLNGNQTFTGLLNFTSVGNRFSGNGAGLTNLSGGSISAGTLARSSLSADVQSGVGTVGLDLSLLGSVATGAGINPVSVAVSDSFAYVVSELSNTLQVFNINNPAAPTLAGSVTTGNRPYAVAVSGSLAYVVNYGSRSLQVFNISNPAAITLAGSVSTENGPSSVAVSGSFAYVVSQIASRLQVFNISSPAAITLAGSILTGVTPRSVAVSGSFAYVVNYDFNTLEVFNISSPAAITRAGSVSTGANSNPTSIAVSGSFAYVVNSSSNTLQVFNVGSPNPGPPPLMGSVATGNNPNSVAVAGSFAYVVNSNSNTLQAFNISNPATPTLARSVTTGTGPSSVAVSGSLAYVVNANSSTLQVFNAANGVGFGTPLTASSLPGNVALLSAANVGFGGSVSAISLDSATTLRVAAGATTHNQGAHLEWNKNVGDGATYLLNQKGAGPGGIRFGEVSTGNVVTERMRIESNGNVTVVGALAKAGGSFKIDHPLDPENKYLYHSFVESPDMMNIYNGEVTTDGTGYAVITLPDYFQALNRDFRYQLTVIDDDDQSDVVVWAKVVRRIGVDGANTFATRTFRPNVAVSWQVTGIRRDAWAEKNRIPNSVNKPGADKGKLLHPEAFGKPAEAGIMNSRSANEPADEAQPAAAPSR